MNKKGDGRKGGGGGGRGGGLKRCKDLGAKSPSRVIKRGEGGVTKEEVRKT